MQLKKKHLLTAAIIFIFLVLSFFLFQIFFGSNAKLNKHLNIARDLYNEGNYNDAIVEFETALEIDPLCEEAYLGISDSYEMLGDNSITEIDLKNIDDKSFREKYINVFDSTISYYESSMDAIDRGLQNISTDPLRERKNKIEKKIENTRQDYDNTKKEIEKKEKEEKEKYYLDLVNNLTYINSLNIDTDSMKSAETYYITTAEAVENYGPYEKDLKQYIDILYEQRDLEIFKKYLSTPKYQDALDGKIPWYEIGESSDERYNFFEACHYLIMCYQAENKIEEILKIKKMAADIIGNDFFVNGWKIPAEYDSSLIDEYDKYDQNTKTVGTNYTCTWEFDSHGNKVHYTDSDGMEKRLSYDSNNRLIKFDVLYGGVLDYYATYEYSGITDSYGKVYSDYYAQDGTKNFDISMDIDGLGNVIYTYTGGLFGY